MRGPVQQHGYASAHRSVNVCHSPLRVTTNGYKHLQQSVSHHQVALQACRSSGKVPYYDHPQQLQVPEQHSQSPRQHHRVSTGLLSKASRAAGVVLLGGCWLLGRQPAPAVAGGIRSPQPVETVVSIVPHSVATAAATNESDSFTMLMAVCVAFWVISATVSAGIGAVMRLAGRPMAYAAGGGGGGWTSTNVMDMDIMPLPLTYEDEPVGGPSSRASRDGVIYKSWDGPNTYIPVSMVKVFQPGMLEAGRVARPHMLQAESSKLSIVSVTRPADASLTSKLPANGNGSSNGSTNSKSSSNGSTGSSYGNQDDRKE